MRRNIAKRTWGVLGKQQTFYSPGQFIENKPKVPLNNTPVDAWDYKKSKYYRIDLVPIEVQQGGVPEPTSTANYCIEYTIANTGFGSTTFIWTNCDGTSGTTTLSFGASTTICAINGSVSFNVNGTITPGGSCTITPTPSPTPSPTPLPATWDTYNVQWNNANTNWNNA